MRKLLTVLFVLAAYFVPTAKAQSTVGGVSVRKLSDLCQMGVTLNATGQGSAKRYIETTLQGRFAMGLSTTQQYKAQMSWIRSNCPAYY